MKKLLLILLCVPLIGFGQSSDDNKDQEWKLYKYYNSYLKRISKDILHNFYFKSSTKKKEIAITFDDGPLKNTKDILSFLLQNDLPATFFLVTDKLNKDNIMLYQDSLIEVGMHTHSHLDYSELTKEEKEKDINKCIEIFNKYDLQIKYFRPAYGIIDKDISEILNANNLEGIIWSLDSHDWNGYKGERLINNIINNIHPGAIILFHDRIDILDLIKITEEVYLKGFKIVPLSELTKYSSEFPY